MRPARIILGSACAAGGLLCAIAPAAGRALPAEYFAHRGLHGGGVPENSLAAFRLAGEAGYGVELDVRLDGDGNVRVFHDAGLLRMTGYDGDFERTPSSVINRLRLSGTAERIPLFSDALKALEGVPLLVELKRTGSFAALCAKTLALLSGRSGGFAVESFDPRIPAWFHLHAPEITRGQLLPRRAAKVSAARKLERAALDTQLANAVSRPHFISFEKALARDPLVRAVLALGAAPAVWTIRSKGEELPGAACIFEGYRP